jgi:hypothetical protein
MKRAVDPVMDGLAGLPPIAPDPRRADRVRARAHAALERRHRSATRLARGERLAERLLHPIVVGALSIAYLAVVVHAALALSGYGSDLR